MLQEMRRFQGIPAKTSETPNGGLDVDYREQAERDARRIVEEYNARHAFHPLAGNDGEWTLENYRCQFELACVKIAWLSATLAEAEAHIERLEQRVHQREEERDER